jgi:4,5-DOPA dioxygenase extradiol
MTSETIPPALFLAHGAPTTAIRDTLYTRYLDRLGATLRPRAVVVFTAHWESPVTTLTWRDDAHETIHDFGPWWPPELFAQRYPAPGSTALAAEARDLLRLAGIATAADAGRGLDHGSWTLLTRLFPAADIPVVQVSVNPDLPPAGQFCIGAALRGLRHRGVLILASGVTVHNLWLRNVPATEPWALEFDDWLLDRLRANDRAALFDYAAQAPHAAKAVPTTEHFLPLFIALGAMLPGEVPHVVYRGYENLLSYLSLAFDQPGNSPSLVSPEDASTGVAGATPAPATAG